MNVAEQYMFITVFVAPDTLRAAAQPFFRHDMNGGLPLNADVLCIEA